METGRYVGRVGRNSVPGCGGCTDCPVRASNPCRYICAAGTGQHLEVNPCKKSKRNITAATSSGRGNRRTPRVHPAFHFDTLQHTPPEPCSHRAARPRRSSLLALAPPNQPHVAIILVGTAGRASSRKSRVLHPHGEASTKKASSKTPPSHRTSPARGVKSALLSPFISDDAN